MDISLEKAKNNKLFYFVVTGVIFHPKKKKCLILKRSKKETAHPGLWGVVGGKLEWEDLKNSPPSRQNHDILDWEGMVEKLLQREAKEESGLEVDNFQYLDSVVFIRPDKVPVVCCKFATLYRKGRVVLAPEFDDYAWVDGEEIEEYRCIDGIKQEVRKTITLYLTLN